MTHCPFCHAILPDIGALAGHLADKHAERITGPPLPPHLARVADGIVQGWTNKRIAYETGLTVGVVKDYLTEAYGRLGFSRRDCTPRVALALWWAEQKREANT